MIRLYLLGYKGLAIISSIGSDRAGLIDEVIISKDSNIDNDYYHDIVFECQKRNLRYHDKSSAPEVVSEYSLAIGWRWLIHDENTVIIFHDSLLPRLRGFNPLVTALINGDRDVGVTTLFADDEYDKGNIINQKSLKIIYPIKIHTAIENISTLYIELFLDLIENILTKNINSIRQEEHNATYSLWRGENDYMINWDWEAKKIKRFIDAVGYPYHGAKTLLDSEILTIYDSEEAGDCIIENRVPGKVIFKNEESITIVCGKGLIRIKELYKSDKETFDYSKKFRLHFRS